MNAHGEKDQYAKIQFKMLKELKIQNDNESIK